MAHKPVTHSEFIFTADLKALIQEQGEEVTRAVLNGIDAVGSRDIEELRVVWRNLSSLPREDVIKELLSLVEYYVYQADDAGIDFISLSFPENADGIVDSIVKHDAIGLKNALDSDKLADLFASLLIILSALKDACPDHIATA